MGKAIIFDGNSILNRAFYGVRPLSTPDGFPTNALFGFVGMVNKAINSLESEPSFAYIAFDLKEKTFRHLACDSYKATRKPMPDDLALQLPVAKDISRALGMTVVEKAGFEADDILGTLSRLLSESGDEVYIVTGDRDSFQLVNDRVTVLLASNDNTQRITPEVILEKYGVEPRKLIDIKAIMGDSSDNIAGVPGIGEKGAIKLITEYGSLESVLEHASEVKGAVGNKLRDGRESAIMSKFLAEIKLDVPLDFDPRDNIYNGCDALKLKELYLRLGFRQFLERLDLSAPVAEVDEVVYLMSELCPTVGRTVYLHTSNGILSVFTDERTFVGDEDNIKRITDCERIVCWSSKDALHLMRRFDIEPDCRIDDISLLAYIASPTDNGVSFAKVALDKLGVSCPDVCVSLLPQIESILRESMTEDMVKLYNEVELPLAKLLCDMESIGFSVDSDALDRFSGELSESIAETEEAIVAHAGERFNINSPKQLGHILFEKLELPHFRKTKSGYSTDVSVLEKLINRHPIVELILDYRKDTKLKSTYCDGLSKQISDDGRIHTTFKQTQTLTGRLSSAEPNLQNIPVRSERGRELRKFFVADEGKILIDADYSQIELRVLAHVSNDSNMIDAFLSGEDIHTVTASQVFGVPVSMVNSEMRKRAKAVNFGIIYGIGDFSLSQDLKISKKTAADYIESYLTKYSEVRDYLERTKLFARANGYVETMFGRRRYIPELASTNRNLQAFGERVAMNTPIQGAAADLIKIAMIRTDRMLREAGLESRLILQIHDELIIEAPIGEADRAEAILHEAMEGAASLSVPLQVDIGRGKSWYDAKD